MKSKANSDSATRPPASSGPSVPISVYRELAAELQATRAMVNSLNQKNQELTLHNQKLRQEILRFAQAAMNLKVLVEPAQQPVSSARSSSSYAEPEPVTPTLEETAAASAIAAKLRGVDADTAVESLFTEEQARPQRLTQKPRDLGGLWLILTITVIMVTAFGAGFLVVRPLLPTSNGK
ncbi:MAG: hypothetical protein Kow00121_59520 [Elainellaceae cyanobacterium]